MAPKMKPSPIGAPAPLDEGLSGPERRRAQTKAALERHNARLAAMTRLEQLAWKRRGFLGEGFDPYLPHERKEAEAIQAAMDDLVHRARALNYELGRRLRREAEGNYGKARLLEALDEAPLTRINLAPF